MLFTVSALIVTISAISASLWKLRQMRRRVDTSPGRETPECLPVDVNAWRDSAEPLPDAFPLTLDDRPASDRTVLLGRGIVNREMTQTRPDATVGAHEDVTLDFADTPHGLVLGNAGSGKTSLCESALAQWLAAGNLGVVVNNRPVEYAAFEGTTGVLAVARDTASAEVAISDVRDEMLDRYERCRDAGVVNYADIPGDQPLKPLLLIVDPVMEFLGQEKVADADADVIGRNEAARRMLDNVAHIIRLGRAVGVHVLLPCTRADSDDFVYGENERGVRYDLRNSFEARVLLGPADDTGRGMAGFLKSGAKATPGIRGRGLYGRVGAAPQEVQFAYLQARYEAGEDAETASVSPRTYPAKEVQQ